MSYVFYGESYLTLLASATNRREPLLSAVDETGRPNKTLVHSGFRNILETSGRFFYGFPIFVGQFFSVFSSQVFLKLFKFEQFWMWTFFKIYLKTEQFFEIWMILKLNNI
jgi:hypothetical protein